MENKNNKDILERNEKIRQFMIDNPEYLKGNFHEVMDKFPGATYEAVRHIARRLRQRADSANTGETIVEFKVTEEVLKRKENAQIKALKKNLEQSIKEYEELSDRLDIVLNIKTSPINVQVPSISSNHNLKNEAAAIVQISDGHFGKLILPRTVNGLNEYNPEIARRRMRKCAENTLKLIRKEREAITIDNLVLILGGDFIENSQLHNHSEMTTTLSPMEEVVFARELLTEYIKTIQEYGKFKKIIIPCVRGNHSRITKKMVASVDYRMNYEMILYSILKGDFKDDVFEWYIPDSEVAEVEVFGRIIRVIHGHSVKYNGGTGGLAVPLNKFLLRMDQNTYAEHTFLHHFHQLMYPTKNSTVNGSIVGYDPYALSLALPYEPPQQSLQLLDKERGITVRCPIFLD